MFNIPTSIRAIIVAVVVAIPLKVAGATIAFDMSSPSTGNSKVNGLGAYGLAAREKFLDVQLFAKSTTSSSWSSRTCISSGGNWAGFVDALPAGDYHVKARVRWYTLTGGVFEYHELETPVSTIAVGCADDATAGVEPDVAVAERTPRDRILIVGANYTTRDDAGPAAVGGAGIDVAMVVEAPMGAKPLGAAVIVMLPGGAWLTKSETLKFEPHVPLRVWVPLQVVPAHFDPTQLSIRAIALVETAKGEQLAVEGESHVQNPDFEARRREKR